LKEEKIKQITKETLYTQLYYIEKCSIGIHCKFGHCNWWYQNY